MSSGNASINLPAWDGLARNMGDVWRLAKGTHEAVCSLFTHPLGAEIRLIIDHEMHRTQAGRDGQVLVDLAFEWKQQFLDRAWR